jgi:hypothetical protein
MVKQHGLSSGFHEKKAMKLGPPVDLLLACLVCSAHRQTTALQFPYDSGDRRTAAEILGESAATARRFKKRLFVVVGSSWCGPCKVFWNSLHTKTVWKALDKYYVVLKLDDYEPKEKAHLINRGTAELVKNWAGSQPALPYYAVLSPDLKFLADSLDRTADGPPFPGYPGITSKAGDHLRGVLKKTAKGITASELKELEQFMANYEG